MSEAVLLILVSLLMLWAGAETLVSGASRVAKTMGLTPTVVGLTIVAYGTSMPEWVVSTMAAHNGRGDLAVGNIVGSNICNVGIVLGLAALCRPLRLSRGAPLNHVLFMLSAALVVTLFLVDGRVSRWEGAVLVGASVVYTTVSVRGARRAAIHYSGKPDVARVKVAWKSVVQSCAFVVVGLVLLIWGGRILVQGAVFIAQTLEVSEAVIALTVVAVGTSAPDCAAAIIAALRGSGGLAAGTAIGSILFNLLFVLGAASLVRPIQANDITAADHVIHLSFLVLSFVHIRSGMTISRTEGLFCVLAYTAYLVVRWPS